jgi:DtxR family Mn-dependent transcriptional regulator
MPKDSPIGRDHPVPPVATSPSEEMYLITVARAEEEGWRGPLPLASLAEALSISPVSANQMVWRLVDRGLLEYQPYQGVLLTVAGRVAARRVLRGRRLWTAFLTEHLGFGEGEADALACDLEHLTPPRVADRLETYLGGGSASPAGRGHAEDGPAGFSQGSS